MSFPDVDKSDASMRLLGRRLIFAVVIVSVLAIVFAM
jgi:hypothetical protein